jgi:hypothetical protein
LTLDNQSSVRSETPTPESHTLPLGPNPDSSYGALAFGLSPTRISLTGNPARTHCPLRRRPANADPQRCLGLEPSARLLGLRPRSFATGPLLHPQGIEFARPPGDQLFIGDVEVETRAT